MKVIHHIPPKWAPEFGYQELMITFVPWILGLEYEGYAKWLRYRPEGSYLILNHGTFERDVKHTLSVSTTLVAAERCEADEIVLPDKLGDADTTNLLTIAALKYVPPKFNLMFVPQARTFREWMYSYNVMRVAIGLWQRLAPKTGRFPIAFVGLSSLRRATGLRFQPRSRGQMIEYLPPDFSGHLLGLNSISYFLNTEGPLSVSTHAVRSLDTCEAFALAKRNLGFSSDSPRVFLGDLDDYDDMSLDQLELAADNMALISKEVSKWS